MNNRSRFNPEKLNAAKVLLDDGASYTEVARTLGMCKKTLRRHFPGRGYTQEQINESMALGRLEARLPVKNGKTLKKEKTDGG